MTQAISAGLLLGMLSSFHCVGMCGPLALSLPVQHLSKQRQVSATALYHVGRILTYSLLGLIFGFFGRRLFLAGWQQWFSVASGAFMLFVVYQYHIRKNPMQPAWLTYLQRRVQLLLQRLFTTTNQSGFLVIGMANGLLPCGMVYLAIAGSLNTTEVADAVLFMSSFGFGTLPAMIALTALGLRIRLEYRQYIRKLFPVVITAVGILLILRGMNLGIPYISPELNPLFGSESTSCP